MLLDDYQEQAGTTAIYPRVYTEQQVRDILLMFEQGSAARYIDRDVFAQHVDNLLDDFETPFNRLVYPVLGLVGEAGEIANKLKKVARDESGQTSVEKQDEIAEELGDQLWYTAAIARELRVPLSVIAQDNLDKLYSRQQRGTLGGSGDTR